MSVSVSRAGLVHAFVVSICTPLPDRSWLLSCSGDTDINHERTPACPASCHIADGYTNATYRIRCSFTPSVPLRPCLEVGMALDVCEPPSSHLRHVQSPRSDTACGAGPKAVIRPWVACRPVCPPTVRTVRR